jgi:hypothetical protein
MQYATTAARKGLIRSRFDRQRGREEDEDPIQV